jgi:hypothetical protein
VSEEARDWRAFIEAMAKLLELPLVDELKPGIIANLEVTRRHAAILDGFVPDDHLDPAPVFRP